MKTRRFAAAALLVLAAIPASAQTLTTMLPSLSWPEGQITTSTKGCEAPVDATGDAAVCAPQE